jgi:hypothetical protein
MIHAHYYNSKKLVPSNKIKSVPSSSKKLPETGGNGGAILSVSDEKIPFPK